MEIGERIADMLARLVCVKSPSQNNEATLDGARNALYLEWGLSLEKWEPLMVGAQ